MPTDSPLDRAFSAAEATLAAARRDPAFMSGCEDFVNAAVATFLRGGRIFACGNGGSMGDAMHFAGEWTGRFRDDRNPMPAQALSDPVAITSIANDFGYDEVFARQLTGQARAGDLLLAISTSGESANICKAVAVAHSHSVTTVGLLGKKGGKLKDQVDIPIVVPLATTTDRIQEVHIQVIHAVIEAVERRLFAQNYKTSPQADTRDS